MKEFFRLSFSRQIHPFDCAHPGTLQLATKVGCCHDSLDDLELHLDEESMSAYVEHVKLFFLANRIEDNKKVSM